MRRVAIFVRHRHKPPLPWRAAVFGLRHKVHEHNYLSAKWAKEVTPPGRYVAGFVSSTNPDFLQPVGKLTPEEVREGYKEQIGALLEGGVDLIMIVGNQLDTSIIAIQVAKTLSNLPVVAQNVFYRGKKGYRTMMGHDPATASKAVQDAGADIVGASCGLMKRSEDESDPRSYYQFATSLVEEMRAGCTAPLSIQPNAGLAQIVGGKTIYPATPDELAQACSEWINAGARIVGGCCGTSLEHYRKLKVAIKSLKRDRCSS